MTTANAPTTWQEANHRGLIDALADLRRRIESGQPFETSSVDEGITVEDGRNIQPLGLDALTSAFRLSSFERDLLLTCAGVELDGEFAAALAENTAGAAPHDLTFGRLLATIPGAHWSATAPTGPLRLWRLIEVGVGHGLVNAPLRIDERVLHFLTGVPTIDERLVPVIKPVAGGQQPPASHLALADRAVSLWAQAEPGTAVPVVQLVGGDWGACRDIATTVASRLGIALYECDATSLPTDAVDLTPLMRLWDRESVLANAALLLSCGGIDPTTDPARHTVVSRFVNGVGSPLLMYVTGGPWAVERLSITIDVPKPLPAEQRELWREGTGESIEGHLYEVIDRFDLHPTTIRTVAAEVTSVWDPDGPQAAIDRAWEECRSAGRKQLGPLTQRIDPVADWDDLVLPEAQLATLRVIAGQVRNRRLVYDEWGFGSKGSRGLGISALFAGPSGTGKTMAGEVIARDLRLDLYRIDLSAVVSKYIGETEKNLARVFDAAEDGGAVLLFDEADALFGKRSEVKDSHDRYANIEVSYLLQRMEAYRGLAILTTNLKSALDTAFLRRIRFVVQFPFPDASQRAELWRRAFPPSTPIDNLEANLLARLNVAGGNIRNIAMNAAFLAASDRTPVSMSHVLSAVRSEYQKLEKTLTDAEVRGWA